MKKIILCLLACTLIFTSCNDDDDNDDTSTNQANILGNWQLSSETSNGEATTLTDCELQDFLLFESNWIEWFDNEVDPSQYEKIRHGWSVESIHVFARRVEYSHMEWRVELICLIHQKTRMSKTLKIIILHGWTTEMI